MGPSFALSQQPLQRRLRRRIWLCGGVAGAIGLIVAVVVLWQLRSTSVTPPRQPHYQPRQQVNTSGLFLVAAHLDPWPADASLEVVRASWSRAGYRLLDKLDQQHARGHLPAHQLSMNKALACNYEGQPRQAYALLQEARDLVEADPPLAEHWLYTIIYLQGMAGLRLGEDENCILCRGESSCILPILPAAVHTNAEGSRLAIRHFTEYLQMFPNDFAVRWLLNLAHMTLGEHPGRVEPRFIVPLDRYLKSEFDIGRFRDIGHLVGLNRLNQGGSSIMEDFDNDGLFDIVVSSFDPTAPMGFYRNQGDGTFADRTEQAGLSGQLGGIYCVQTDYNNDGLMDIFVSRGAWVGPPVRQSLLRNNGNGTFTDVTHEAGLNGAVNSSSACWADYDNDGRLDLFICCERQPNRLYHNRGNGTFEDVSEKVGLHSTGRTTKGAAWIDYDNDGYPDLFLNYFDGSARLFHNNRGGGFTEVTADMGINGPVRGFSCWAFDFDNDGWLDIFTTCYNGTAADVVKGLLGEPHSRSSRLYRNVGGKRFADVSAEAGLDMPFLTMGSNFGDLDNDGYLDMYLGTGEPDLAALVPNRMFKNVAGKRFAEITASAGTGHLQKGHGIAIGDWDRDGNADVFIQMGGAVGGDKYHNILFQNPGHANHWLTVKLIGQKTNRAAIGARIKVVTAGPQPLTIHRHVSSGSSFGANPLEQHIGLGMADRVAELEITWPTSGTTQVFRDIAVNQFIEATEFAKDYRKRHVPRVPVPSHPRSE